MSPRFRGPVLLMLSALIIGCLCSFLSNQVEGLLATGIALSMALMWVVPAYIVRHKPAHIFLLCTVGLLPIRWGFGLSAIAYGIGCLDMDPLILTLATWSISVLTLTAEIWFLAKLDVPSVQPDTQEKK